MNQKGKLIYCFDAELKAKLEQQGFKPIHVTKIDNKQVWVFNKTIPLLNFYILMNNQN